MRRMSKVVESTEMECEELVAISISAVTVSSEKKEGMSAGSTHQRSAGAAQSLK